MPSQFFAQQASSFTVDMIDYLKATQPDMVPADKSKTSTPTFDLAQYANELARRANNFAQYADDLVQYASGVKLTQANSDSITQDKKPIYWTIYRWMIAMKILCIITIKILRLKVRKRQPITNVFVTILQIKIGKN